MQCGSGRQVDLAAGHYTLCSVGIHPAQATQHELLIAEDVMLAECHGGCLFQMIHDFKLQQHWPSPEFQQSVRFSSSDAMKTSRALHLVPLLLLCAG